MSPSINALILRLAKLNLICPRQGAMVSPSVCNSNLHFPVYAEQQFVPRASRPPIVIDDHLECHNTKAKT